MLLLLVIWHFRPVAPVALRVTSDGVVLPGDGVSIAHVRACAVDGELSSERGLEMVVRSDIHSARVEQLRFVQPCWTASVRAGVLPGRVVLVASGEGYRAAELELNTQ